MLNQNQLDKFEKDGFLVIDNFYSLSEVDDMKRCAQSHLDECELTPNHPLTTFTTDEDQHVGDEYFLKSSDKVSFFFEDGAVKDGKLTVPLSQAINKIGHYLHAKDNIFKAMTLNDRVNSVIRSLRYSKPIILQSMLIFKQPRIGGKVSPHQDNTFLYTRPYSTCGFWLPLEDATTENGCLWFIPGSHRWPVLRRFVRNPDYFESPDLRGSTGRKGEKGVIFEYDEGYEALPEQHSEYKAVEVKAGSAVLIHGSVVHKSLANTSDRSRFAYAFHIIEGAYDYPKENWLQMNDGNQFPAVYDNESVEGQNKPGPERKPLPN